MSTILSALALVAASSGLLVSADELATLLKDPAVVVVAVGNSADEFTAGHIPGARFVLYRDIAPDIDGLQSELPPVDQLRRVLANAGINDRSKVVIYGSTIGATRLFFTLDYFGHPNVRVLNGGLTAWKARNRQLEVAPPATATASTLTPNPRPDRVVSADWIKERLSTTKMTLLDARPDAELRKKYEAIGATTGTPLVSYCMVGMRASVTYFVARHLGYDARMYDGSIEDWTQRKLPARTGR